MGAYLSEPMTVKESEDGSGNNIKFGASSMQGWRVSQEDAHNCVAEFDKNSSFFALYDGHGGAEVAIYLSHHLPDLLKKTESYSKEDASAALTEAFLEMDASIKRAHVQAELHRIAKVENGDESAADYEEENVGQLYEEATMPLDKLVAQYTHNGPEVKEESSASETAGPSAGSSRKIVFKAGSSKSEKGQATVDDSNIASGSGSSKTDKVAQEPTSTTTSGCNAVKSDLSQVAGSSPSSSSSKIVQNDIEAEGSVQVPDVDGSCSSSENVHTEVTSNGSKSEFQKSTSDSVKDPLPVECVKGKVESSSGVTKEGKQQSNGVENVEIEITTVTKEETNTLLSEVSVKPRKGKVHPVPVFVTQESLENKPLRVSPRKGRNLANMAFADSESDLDSSDSDGAENNLERNSSSSEESSDEEEGDDDEDDSDEDSEEYDIDEIREAYEKEKRCDRYSDIQEPGYDSGCTAVVSFMKWKGDKLNLWVANAGDSRCVVSRGGDALEMSYDHKPESEAEALRIVNAGGKVTEDGRVNGGLNLSRAIGDHSYKQNEKLPPEEQMISPLPSIQHVELDPTQDEFIVLACDGVWNSLSSQEVVDFVASRIKTAPTLSKICEELFDACLSPDTNGDGTGCDNMTAIIIQLSKGSNANKRSREEPEIDESSKKPKMEV